MIPVESRESNSSFLSFSSSSFRSFFCFSAFKRAAFSASKSSTISLSCASRSRCRFNAFDLSAASPSTRICERARSSSSFPIWSWRVSTWFFLSETLSETTCIRKFNSRLPRKISEWPVLSCHSTLSLFFACSSQPLGAVDYLYEFSPPAKKCI